MLGEVKELERNGPINLENLPSSWLKDEIEFLREMVKSADNDASRFQKYIEEGFKFLHLGLGVFCVVCCAFLVTLLARVCLRKKRFKDNDQFFLKNFLK